MRLNATNMKRDVLVLNLEAQCQEIADKLFGHSLKECTDGEAYTVLLSMIKRLLKVTERNTGEKKVYYLSMEFLPGRMMGAYLTNLGLYDRVRDLMKSNGKCLDSILECETEPALGAGGRGRLAACYMESIATLGLPGEGIGLNYHYGFFRQVFRDRKQCEEKDVWLPEPPSAGSEPEAANPAPGSADTSWNRDEAIVRGTWENPTDIRFDVEFGDRTVSSRLYDIDIVGYGNGINKLRLFDIETADGSIVGEGTSFDQTDIERGLTLFLYPDESSPAGRDFRIYQQYFLVSSAAQLILRELKARQYDLRRMHDWAVIQINDTLPALIIPELTRILVEEKAFTVDEALEVVAKTCAYTNHTIEIEKIQKIPLAALERIVPRLIPYIRAMDGQVAANFPDKAVRIIDANGMVDMEAMCIHYSFSVNGVGELHTEILTGSERAPFYHIYPEKFNVKTDGVSLRRFLLSSNRPLASFISSKIGDSYKEDETKLDRLLEYTNDDSALEALLEIKQDAKRRLALTVAEKEGVCLIPDGIYDVHVKGFQEHKRQQLFALCVIHKYLEIRSGIKPVRPINFITGGKAQKDSEFGKDLIHLFLALQELVNNDPEVNGSMRMVMLTNSSVTYAEKVIPACDIAEQLTLASREAAGTGVMKMMLNGAIILGTMDGAVAEMSRLVGNEILYPFGSDAGKVIEITKGGEYDPIVYYGLSDKLRRAVDFITGPELAAVGDPAALKRVRDEFLSRDAYMSLLDFEDYVDEKDRAFRDYENRTAWAVKMMTNIAKAGYFSADRAVNEYRRDIWHLHAESGKRE